MTAPSAGRARSVCRPASEPAAAFSRLTPLRVNWTFATNGGLRRADGLSPSQTLREVGVSRSSFARTAVRDCRCQVHLAPRSNGPELAVLAPAAERGRLDGRETTQCQSR